MGMRISVVRGKTEGKFDVVVDGKTVAKGMTKANALKKQQEIRNNGGA